MLAEVRHPILAPFFALVPITGMLLAFGLAPHAHGAAQALFIVFLAATLLFGAGFGTSAEQVSMLAVFCVSFSNSVAIADTSESGSPVLSEAERCRASKILLIRFSPRDDAHFDGLFLFRPRTT